MNLYGIPVRQAENVFPLTEAIHRGAARLISKNDRTPAPAPTQTHFLAVPDLD